jgi:hypothetical protein
LRQALCSLLFVVLTQGAENSVLDNKKRGTCLLLTHIPLVSNKGLTGHTDLAPVYSISHAVLFVGLHYRYRLSL